MTAFPKGTTTQEVNPKIGDTFRLVEPDNNFRVGDILKFNGSRDFDTSYFINQDGRRNWTLWGNLEPIDHIPTWETLQEGDVLENDKKDYDLIVQGRMGRIIFYLANNDRCEHLSIRDLQKYDWKIKSTQQQPKKMTVSEVAKALGHEVEIEG